MTTAKLIGKHEPGTEGWDEARKFGLGGSEVAAVLDLSPGSVGTSVRRAESALRKELNRHASSQ